jgi:hypothetical protein
VVTGLLTGQTAEVEAALEALGPRVVGRRQRGQWRLLERELLESAKRAPAQLEEPCLEPNACGQLVVRIH